MPLSRPLCSRLRANDYLGHGASELCLRSCSFRHSLDRSSSKPRSGLSLKARRLLPASGRQPPPTVLFPHAFLNPSAPYRTALSHLSRSLRSCLNPHGGARRLSWREAEPGMTGHDTSRNKASSGWVLLLHDVPTLSYGCAWRRDKRYHGGVGSSLPTWNLRSLTASLMRGWRRLGRVGQEHDRQADEDHSSERLLEGGAPHVPTHRVRRPPLSLDVAPGCVICVSSLPAGRQRGLQCSRCHSGQAQANSRWDDARSRVSRAG